MNPEDWEVVLTSLILKYHSYSPQGGKFLCLGCYFTLLQDLHDFDDTLEDVRELEDCRSVIVCIFVKQNVSG